MRVTESLSRGGAADYSWCTEEGAWRGNEVHRATLLLDEGTLDRRSVDKKHRGFVAAWERAKTECHLIPIRCEVELGCVRLNLKGRADRFGKLRGRDGVFEIKTGAIRPATALQLALYGYMDDPKRWWARAAFELRADGSYRFHRYPVSTWMSDLSTALAFVRNATGKPTDSDIIRIERWKMLYKV